MSAGAPRLALDTGRLARWAAEHLPEAAEIRVLRQFSGGQSNPTYLLETGGGRFVLRRKPPGPLLPKAHMIEREYRVMAALGAAGFPVPAMRAYCRDSEVIGAEFFVMDHVAGRVFFDTTLPELAPADRRRLYERAVDRLADLHALDAEALGLGDFGRPGGYLARQVAVWSRQYAASETRDIPEMHRLAGWLGEAAGDVPDAAALVHGDWRLDNLIVAPEAPEIAAVLDWELATLGHPLADLAYFLMTWTFPEGLRYGLGEADLAGLGIPGLEALAERYAARSGRSVAGLDLMLAFSTFRIAAILAGVAARARTGSAADPQAARFEADVPKLAAVGWAHARRAGA